MFKGKYIKGQRNGRWNFYYDNGNIRAEINYKNGKKVDLWKFYDEDGNIKEERYYI